MILYKKIAILGIFVFLTSCAGTGNKPLTAEGLFDQHVKVAFHGKGMGVHQSVTQHGTLFIDDFGIESPVVMKSMAPNFMLFETNVMGMDISQGCNADSCWAQQPGQPTNTLDGDMLELTRLQSDPHSWENIGQYYSTLEIVPDDNADESTEYTVKAVSKSGREDLYYFSKESGLIVGTTVTLDSPMGEITQHTSLKDYEDTGGVMMPKTIEQNSSMANVRIVIESTSFEPLSTSDFVRAE